MKVLKSDLSKMRVEAGKVFAAEMQDGKKLTKALENFINQIGVNKKLSGPAYEYIKQELEKYKNKMEIRCTLATNLKESINNALVSMETYMDEYDELDYDKLSQVKSDLEDANSYISSSYDKLDKNKGTLTIEEKKKIKLTIATYEDSVETLTKLKEKLEGLAAADASAMGNLSGVTSDLSAYTANTYNV